MQKRVTACKRHIVWSSACKSIFSPLLAKNALNQTVWKVSQLIKGCHNCLAMLTNCCIPRKMPKKYRCDPPPFASDLKSFAPAGTPIQDSTRSFLAIKRWRMCGQQTAHCCIFRNDLRNPTTFCLLIGSCFFQRVHNTLSLQRSKNHALQDVGILLT